jgi:hypothetical protein
VTQRAVEGGKTEVRFADGTRLVVFRNGTEKEARPDGTAVVRFSNGDVKRTVPRPGGGAPAEYYFYSGAGGGTLQVTYPPPPGGGGAACDVFEFASGQVELHWGAGADGAPDGRTGAKEIVYADGTVKVVDARGEGRTTFPDGRTLVEAHGGGEEDA